MITIIGKPCLHKIARCRYRQLVLQEQKVESLQARSAHNRDPNLFLIAASIMEKEDMEYVQTAILTAIDEAAKQPINPDR